LDSWYAFDVLEDKKGSIWIASDQSGAFHVDNATGTITNFTTNDGLGHKRNMCIYEDLAGNIWIGGQGGLSRYNGNEFINFTTEDGLPHNDINTIIEDKSGNIWFGTRGNAGVYDGNTFSEIKNDKGEAFFNVWSIVEDKKGNIWLVDSVGLWKYNGGRFTLKSSDIWKVYEDKKGDLLSTGMLRGGGSVLKRMESKSLEDEKIKTVEIFKSNNMFFGIVEDKKGNIWIGGGDGIWHYNGKTVSYFTGIVSNECN
jgi:ligand-binding sensor domain-containing protein